MHVLNITLWILVRLILFLVALLTQRVPVELMEAIYI